MSAIKQVLPSSSEVAWPSRACCSTQHACRHRAAQDWKPYTCLPADDPDVTQSARALVWPQSPGRSSAPQQRTGSCRPATFHSRRVVQPAAGHRQQCLTCFCSDLMHSQHESRHVLDFQGRSSAQVVNLHPDAGSTSVTESWGCSGATTLREQEREAVPQPPCS